MLDIPVVLPLTVLGLIVVPRIVVWLLVVPNVVVPESTV